MPYNARMRLQKTLQTILVAISLTILVSACSAPSKKTFKQNAEIVAEQLFKLMKEEKYIELVKLYDKRFFERLSPAMWVEDLRKLNKKLGEFQSLKETAYSVQLSFNRNSTATTVLVYRIQYQKSYTIQKLTILSDANAENMRIVGHYIDFPETASEKNP